MQCLLHWTQISQNVLPSSEAKVMFSRASASHSVQQRGGCIPASTWTGGIPQHGPRQEGIWQHPTGQVGWGLGYVDRVRGFDSRGVYTGVCVNRGLVHSSPPAPPHPISEIQSVRILLEYILVYFKNQNTRNFQIISRNFVRLWAELLQTFVLL